MWALRKAIYDDVLPHMCCAELFGLGHTDDSLNSLVLGVWQGAVKIHKTATLPEVRDALVQNKLRDLFHQTVRDRAARGHLYSLCLVERLDDVYFRLYS